MDWTSLINANEFESYDILTELIDIRSLLQQLHWYGFVNYEKILVKVAKFSNTSTTDAGLQDLLRSNVNVQAKCGHHLTLVTQRLAKTSKNGDTPCRTSLLPSLLQERYETYLRQHVEKAIQAIQADDSSMLEIALEHKAGKQVLHQDDNHLFGDMLFYCIILQSRFCLRYLLHYAQFFSENSKHLAQLTIKMGRISSAKFRGTKPVKDLTATIDLPRATDLFLYVIRRARDYSRVGLFHRDHSGRLPLHYAVQYGLTEVCLCIRELMTQQGFADEATRTAPALIEDEQATSPLKLAVLSRNTRLTECLLWSLGGPWVNKGSFLSDLTVLSVKLGSFTILQLLLSTGIDVTFRSYNSETALYVAIKSGWTQATAAILHVIKEQAPAAIDLPEAVRE